VAVIRGHWFGGCAALLACLSVLPALAQNLSARALITAPIDARALTVLRGNTRPEATAANDRGRVADTEPLPHLQLLLNRPGESARALARYIDSLHDRTSPNYRKWLTAAQIAQRFGPPAADITAVTGWLRSQGFTVNAVAPSGMSVDFSGNAGQVTGAFHTEMHRYAVNGVLHLANASDPQLPTALAPAVRGIVSLHDFFPRPLSVPRVQYTVAGSPTFYLLAPADVATIYSMTAPFAAGLTGAGQTIAVVEDSDIYSANDWSTFRSTFNLSGYTSGTLEQTHPMPASGGSNCTDPHVLSNGDDGEATLDAEWASAAAPGATIEVASCRNAATTFGGLIALQNLIDAAVPPAIISISYGECEALQGATGNAAFATAYEQAVAEGVSVFVAAGDAGAAGCDAKMTNATHGIAVNGMASSAFNVAVGGTDFGDTYAGSEASYWSGSNSATDESALSYVPEIPWNDSCAGALLASFEGYAAGYGSNGFCNSIAKSSAFLTTAAGSGGPSGCATGAPTVSGVVSGSCAGNAKPAWQSGVAGIPADGVRDLPDVALFSGNGLWAHYYVYCWSDPNQKSAASCSGAPSTWAGAGGTSFAAPILAGVQALINQASGAAQGNPNHVYYRLASIQAGSGLNCNATNGNAIDSACIFHDVTQGDMAVNCTGSNNCFVPSGTYGQLSTNDATSAPAYAAGAGWDFATGLGSVNVANLINAWNDSDISLSGTAAGLPAGLLSYSLTLTDNGPQNAGGVTLTSSLPAGMSLVTAGSSAACMQAGQTLTCTVGVLSLGATANLTVVIQPGNSSASQLSFLAHSSGGEVDPADGSLTFALNTAAQAADSDGPLPPWAVASLGLLLAALASRTRSA
jgi:uncharacterized repeat protein (TIGR01451 family)